MHKWNDVLTALRREAGLSQKELAERLAAYGVSVTNQAISKWEKGLTQPNAEQFLALCRALAVEDISAAFFGEGSGLLRELNAAGVQKVKEYADVLRASGFYAKLPEPVKGRILPLYSLAVSAGTGEFLDSDDFESVIVGAEVPDAADYGVRIAGDSMQPRYQNGQIVWVQRCRTLRSGEIGVFAYEDCAYLKQMRITEEGIRLHSLNPDYADIVVLDPEALRVLGRAVV